MIKDRYYRIGYRIGNGKLFENKSLLSDYKFLKNPFGRWNADPFPIIINEKKYIFAESASILSRKGIIMYICLSDKKPRWRKAISEPFHMSFPNIYINDEKIYMIPETNKNKTISIYEAVSFPNGWKKNIDIVCGVCAVDTIFNKCSNNRILYSYVTNGKNENALVEYKKTGEFISKIEDKQATLRPAGNMFKYNERVIFPTQNNIRVYGEGIIFYDAHIEKDGSICKLIPYLELSFKDLKIINHYREYVGIHTYNYFDDLEVIDTIELRFSFLGVVHLLAKWLLRIIKKLRNKS